MGHLQRKRFFVNFPIQLAMIARAVGYWLASVVTVTILLIVERILFSGPARPFYTHFDDLWFQFGPALVASALLLPLMMFDALRWSHRVVGPMVRLRRGLHELAEHGQSEDIRFRDRDYWQELAKEFNAVARRMRALQDVQELDAISDEPHPATARR